MRRRLTVRAATLLLALLLPVTSVRASAPSCCLAGDDCDQPCCDRADQTTIAPVLPCCRPVALEQALTDSRATTLEPLQPALAVLTLTHTPADAVVVLTRHRASPTTHPLRAPPLYQRHCALLL